MIARLLLIAFAIAVPIATAAWLLTTVQLGGEYGGP